MDMIKLAGVEDNTQTQILFCVQRLGNKYVSHPGTLRMLWARGVGKCGQGFEILFRACHPSLG